MYMKPVLLKLPYIRHVSAYQQAAEVLMASSFILFFPNGSAQQIELFLQQRIAFEINDEKYEQESVNQKISAIHFFIFVKVLSIIVITNKNQIKSIETTIK